MSSDEFSPIDQLGSLIESTARVAGEEAFVGELIRRELSKSGLELNDDQLRQLARSALSGNSSVDLTLTLEQEALIGDAPGASMTIRLEPDEAEVEPLVAAIQEATAEMYPEIIDECSRALVLSWKDAGKERLTSRHVQTRRVERQLRSLWSTPLCLFDLLWDICTAQGAEFNAQFRPQASRENDLVFECLVRIHAKACQIAGEILVLCQHGFPDGALARWRTLHELAVVQQFIAKEGRPVAQRYLDHVAVANYSEALVYKENAAALEFEPLGDIELAELKQKCDEVCAKYEPSFCRPDGWVPTYIETGNLRGIRAVEQSVSLGSLSPFVRMANSRIHAGPKSVYFSLAQPDHARDMMIAGPSAYGIADPLQHSAFSLTLCTSTLLLYRQSSQTLALARALCQLRDEIFEEIETVLTNAASESDTLPTE